MKRKSPSALPLCKVTEYGKTFETGRPVQFRYLRNTEPAPNFGPRFGQDIEPAGRYLLHNPNPGDLAPHWEKGQIAFKNPLVLQLSTGENVYGPNGWKAHLQRTFKAKRKALSCKLLKAGYDGIVTCDEYGTREIVDLQPLAAVCKRR